MATRVLRRRGSEADHQNFIGEEAEFTFDTTLKNVRIHDGVTEGGFLLVRRDEYDAEFLDHSARHESGGADELGLDTSQIVTGLFADARISESNVKQHTTFDPTADTVMRRDANGRTQVENPASAKDAANKDFVESVMNGLDWQESVIDQQNTPPTTPAEGDRYLIGTSPTDAWSSNPNDVTEYLNGAWEFIQPDENFALIRNSDDTALRWNGTSWVNFGSSVKHNVTQGLQGGDSGLDEYFHLTDSEHASVQYMIQISLDGLTADEVTQLSQIGNVTINNTQWGYLGVMDQDVSQSASVEFASITQGGNQVLDTTDRLRVYDIDGTELTYW